ncbi:PLAT/LH2 domain-containing protein [Eubacterium ruminantium]|nr:PLAT/LH2 domain-containing protein [Eubacterium ruminantium]
MKKKGIIKRIAAFMALSVLLSELPVQHVVEAAAPDAVSESVEAVSGEEILESLGGSVFLADKTTEVSKDDKTSTEDSKDDKKSTEDAGKDKDSEKKDELVKIESYHITSKEGEPEFEQLKNMSEWANRKETDTSKENIYSLTVATGASEGNTVQYIAIRYKDSQNVSRKQFIFPGVDAYDRSEKLLEHICGEDVNKSYGTSLLASFGYEEKYEATKTLKPWTVQDFIFEAESDIASVESIDVYLAQGSWTIQGLAVYKVTGIKGYEEYGLVSGSRFLDFKGYLVADIVKNNSGQLTLSTAGCDSLIAIGAVGSGTAYCDINSYDADQVTKDYAADSSIYTLRLDLADQMKAGFESFLNGNAVSMSNYDGIIEDLAIEIQYKDKRGWVRKVTIPYILSCYAEAMKMSPDAKLIGFGQRGDTLAFQGFFPEMSSIVTNPILYLGKAARTEVEKNGISIMTENSNQSANVQNRIKKNREQIEVTNTDDIKIVGLSVYKGGCMTYTQDGIDSNGKEIPGATLLYTFENESPLMYYTTTDPNGRLIKAGGKDSYKFTAYKSGPVVAAKTGNDMFLVTITTSTRVRAGTSNEVALRIHYSDRDNKKFKTQTYNVKTAANELYGYWPTVEGKDFIAYEGLKEGNSVSFLIDAMNLKSLNAAEISLLGDDEWQLNNMTISYVDTVKPRRAYLYNEKAGKSESRFWIERPMVSAQIFDLANTEYIVTDEEGSVIDVEGNKIITEKVAVLDEDGNPTFDDDGNQVFEEVNVGKDKTLRKGTEILFTAYQKMVLNFNAEMVGDIRDAEYADVRYKMSYEQTGIDWGFFRSKKTYEIGVKVAKDSEFDTGNGDSGSHNYFYFQLIFKNGRSGYVLANQQLSSDGFRSGKLETFTIKTNQDYGELTAIRIIPEDLSQDSDPYDKLNIDQVTVSERTNGGSYMNYVIDQIGWIEIDYRDEMEQVSPDGLKARSEEQIARYFRVTNKSRAVKLLMEIATMPWDNDYYQFQGSVLGEIVYISSTTNKVETATFDVVQCIANYMNKTAISTEAATDPNSQVVKAAGLNTISDPEWMFRENHMDRLILPAIPDLKILKSVQFTCTSRNGYPAIWNIGTVTVSQILEDGTVSINSYEEYYRDMSTKKLWKRATEDVVSTTIPIGKAQKTKVIDFSYNEISWTSDEWATPVSRVPESNDDIVNIYLIPSADSRNIKGVSVKSALQYALPYSQYMQISNDSMKVANSGTKNAMFYLKNISVPNFSMAGKLSIQCTNSDITFDHAIVQHVKEDTVIQTYTYSFADSSAVLGAEAPPISMNSYIEKNEQKVDIQLGRNTPLQELTPMKRDIAVAINYTSTLDPTNTEYSSNFIYLTDLGYDSIEEGLFAEFKFRIPFVKEVTGYTIGAFGNLTGRVDGSCVFNYDVLDTADDPLTGDWYSTKSSVKSYSGMIGSYALKDRIAKHRATSNEFHGDDSIVPVSIEFTTAEATSSGDSGTNSQVRMRFNYTDDKGNARTKTYSDITKYIQGDTKQFVTGETQTVKVFLPEMNSKLSITSIDILPYNGVIVTDSTAMSMANDITDAQTATNTDAVSQTEKEEMMDDFEKMVANRNASWTIEKFVLTIAEGIKAAPIKRTVNLQFRGIKNGGKLLLNNLDMETRVSRNGSGNTLVESGLLKLVARQGDVLTVSVIVYDSSAGYKVKAYKAVGEAEKNITSKTVKRASDLAFSFTVPNEAGVYRIYVSAVDAPDKIDVIEVTVEDVPTTTEKKETETTEESTEKATESTSETTTEATTESTTEATTESTTESTTEESTSEENSDNTTEETSEDTTEAGNTEGELPVVPPEEN